MSLTRDEPNMRTEEVVHKIRRLIEAGELKPGDRLLPQRDLARQLAVSRGSLREALRLLAGMGLLEITPRGTYVRRVHLDDVVKPLTLVMSQSARDVYMLLEARKILESEAAKLAALRADGLDIAKLRELTERMRREIELGEMSQETDIQFHCQIVNASKNHVLSSLMSVLVALMQREYDSVRLEMLVRCPWSFYQQHLGIFDAIEQHDPEGAATKVLDHIEFTIERFLQHLPGDKRQSLLKRFAN
ncbi:MAG: FadR family transcriptional regulator [Alicyclobacillus macrosporangiidus]|uniref:FadR/GntR family transcriptional regulator n=1 Tax=Alicyclobacillus macrosporangiidus TaxID=392015 RepID=UPI0026E9B914|nr:FadR/GntR family transcriptional regulator [Alicyclobacillus macrosporangiidus]MCL6598786.1 FadR family transcriptional regulator [Alicyclobacillus macrosporangiidus]